MTNRTINLTPSAIKALPIPPSTSKANDIEWSDEQIIGLKVLVGRTGNKRYLLRYVSPVTRKKTSIALGRWLVVYLPCAGGLLEDSRVAILLK